jgi:hypothetical protein
MAVEERERLKARPRRRSRGRIEGDRHGARTTHEADNENTGRRTAANVGHEAQLWQMADALPVSVDAAEYTERVRRMTG